VTGGAQMKDPAKEIGDAIIARIASANIKSKINGIYWVDFTVKEVFPGP